MTSLCAQLLPICTHLFTLPFNKLGHLAAIGTQDGRLFVVDLRAAHISKILNVNPNSPVRGVRWISPSKVVCFTTERYVFARTFASLTRFLTLM